METNREIKVEEEFSVGMNVVKEIEGDNDDMKRAPVHAVRTGMNMKKELVKLLEIKK